MHIEQLTILCQVFSGRIRQAGAEKDLKFLQDAGLVAPKKQPTDDLEGWDCTAAGTKFINAILVFGSPSPSASKIVDREEKALLEATEPSPGARYAISYTCHCIRKELKRAGL